MTAKLYAFDSLLVLAGVVSADVCRSGQVCAPVQTYQAPAYVAPAYVAPVAVAVPLYGASYNTGDPETALALQAILEELRALRGEVAGLRGSGAPPGAQAAPRADPAKVLAVHCAACHTEGPKLKGDMAFFDPKGQLLKLNGPDKRAIEKRTREGTMPPPERPKLTPDDKAAIGAFAAGPPLPAPQPAPAKLPEVKK